mgnify:CR=1 FL=1
MLPAGGADHGRGCDPGPGHVRPYETGASRLAIDKRLVCSDFFILITGVAGDILQKLMNYRFKAAIYGDYSHYASKPLRDFIRESNHGKDFFFVSTMKEAVQRLTDAE